MVASGKSSNRFGEWRRGRNGTSSAGPYAAAGKRERERELARKRKQPTQMRCPTQPEGDNSTHHLVPTAGGSMVCRYCKQTRAQILKGVQ